MELLVRDEVISDVYQVSNTQVSQRASQRQIKGRRDQSGGLILRDA